MHYICTTKVNGFTVGKSYDSLNINVTDCTVQILVTNDHGCKTWINVAFFTLWTNLKKFRYIMDTTDLFTEGKVYEGMVVPNNCFYLLVRDDRGLCVFIVPQCFIEVSEKETDPQSLDEKIRDLENKLLLQISRYNQYKHGEANNVIFNAEKEILQTLRAIRKIRKEKENLNQKWEDIKHTVNVDLNNAIGARSKEDLKKLLEKILKDLE